MYLDDVRSRQVRGEAVGIASVCSAHPAVIRETMRLARHFGVPALIESTCNQVNQFGGYTGTNPSTFAASVRALADEIDLPFDCLLLGGDHLGPSVWQLEPARSALQKASDLVRDYVQAGFVKLHLDCSMRLADDPPGGPEPEVVAVRAAQLAAIAEHSNGGSLRYVIGTEVPLPGGATQHDKHPHTTRVEDASSAVEVHRRAFRRQGLEAAWDRVIALVVQPGVEFGDDFVADYQPDHAGDLSRFIMTQAMIYEAHSTDYQPRAALEQLVRVRLGEQLRFEIEAGREPHVGVGRAREAVDAAVLAATIGIDRAVERNVGRVVAGDDTAGGVDRDGGLERRQVLEALPAVVETFARVRLIAAGGVRLRAAATPALAVDRGAGEPSWRRQLRRCARRRHLRRRRRATASSTRRHK